MIAPDLRGFGDVRASRRSVDAYRATRIVGRGAGAARGRGARRTSSATTGAPASRGCSRRCTRTACARSPRCPSATRTCAPHDRAARDKLVHAAVPVRRGRGAAAARRRGAAARVARRRARRRAPGRRTCASPARSPPGSTGTGRTCTRARSCDDARAAAGGGAHAGLWSSRRPLPRPRRRCTRSRTTSRARGATSASTAPATGCSSTRPSEVTRLLLEHLRS